MVDPKSLTIAASEVSKVTNNSVDYLIVNGASIEPEAYFKTPTEFIGQEDLLRRDFIKSVDVNVLGVIYSINAFLPLIRKGNVKKITVISSGLADLELAQKANIAFSVSYSATKAATNIVVAKYAAELKGEGIILLALSPGVVNTATEAPNPEHIPRMVEMGTVFAGFYPNFKGPISPGESVPLQKKVIDNMTIENSGAFLSHLGSKEWL
jgi:NAD(P)-dependent dehydrogenase (short-subunit alcohol dehydrogenase family)